MSFLSSFPRCSSLEDQLHRQLDVALIVNLRSRDDAEVLGVSSNGGSAEPRRVGEVKGFGTELQSQPLLDRKSLEQRDVNLRRTARPDVREARAVGTQCESRLNLEDRWFTITAACCLLPRSGRGQRAGIEPAPQGLLPFRQARVPNQEDAAWRAYRHPGLQRRDSVQLPAACNVAEQ